MFTARSVTCTIWSSVRPAISVFSLPRSSLRGVEPCCAASPAPVCASGATVASAAGAIAAGVAVTATTASPGSGFVAHGRQMSSTTATIMSASMPRNT